MGTSPAVGSVMVVLGTVTEAASATAQVAALAQAIAWVVEATGSEAVIFRAAVAEIVMLLGEAPGDTTGRAHAPVAAAGLPVWDLAAAAVVSVAVAVVVAAGKESRLLNKKSENTSWNYCPQIGTSTDFNGSSAQEYGHASVRRHFQLRRHPLRNNLRILLSLQILRLLIPHSKLPMR
jgi:hypothetical protein